LLFGLGRIFDKKAIENLATTTKFTQRKSKLNAIQFLNSLMFIHQQGKGLSLLDICGDLYDQYGIKIKKQSIQGRFNEKAVRFLKAVLSELLQYQFKAVDKDRSLKSFNRVRIKDSTRNVLPPAFSDAYKGYGGVNNNSESMISIQYEYDLLSGNAMDLRLTTGIRNDQLDSKENTHDIAKNDLFIRDLGYVTIGYLKQIIKGEAYFLNRLNPQIKAYHADNPEKEVDFAKCLKRLKKYNLPFLEYKVLIGKKAQIPSRLIVHLVDQSTYDKRICKTRKQAKSYGHQVSKAFKTRAKLTLYITNTEQDSIPAKEVKKIYGLRWQIELTFKIWKSQAQVHQVKEMKIHRFECQLIAKLIWLLIHQKIFKYLTGWVNYCCPAETASIWKYYKHAYRINNSVRKILTIPDKLMLHILNLMDMASQLLLLETKKGKISHYEALISLD